MATAAEQLGLRAAQIKSVNFHRQNPFIYKSATKNYKSATKIQFSNYNTSLCLVADV